MEDRGDVLKNNFPSHARSLGTREHQQPTAIEMEPEQSPGAVPAGFSSTGTGRRLSKGGGGTLPVNPSMLMVEHCGPGWTQAFCWGGLAL